MSNLADSLSEQPVKWRLPQPKLSDTLPASAANPLQVKPPRRRRRKTTSLPTIAEESQIDISPYCQLNLGEIPQNAFIIICQGRRQGKTTMAESFLEEYSKFHPFDYAFLFSGTDAGFNGMIPVKYRFRTIDKLNDVLRMQEENKFYNDELYDRGGTQREKNFVRSNIVIVCDDLLGTTNNTMRYNHELISLAVNGRHLTDKSGNVNTMCILMTQSLTGIARVIRLQADCLFTSKMCNGIERKLILDENFPQGRLAVNEFEKITYSRDYRFICFCNFRANKRLNHLEDHVFYYDSYFTDRRAPLFVWNMLDNERPIGHVSQFRD